MIDLLSLLKNTGAYRTIKGEKENDRLSHAYLILSPDGDNLNEYLKIFAKLIVCKSEQPCGECRSCKLIENNAYSDVVFYPKNGQSVASEDVNELIEESFIKPIENDKKVFVLSQAQTMNASAQNKLLKTLEEPPKGVHILIGATSEFPLLPTVKSRVKKLEIPTFSKEKLFDALIGKYSDKERLLSAIACGDGTVGKAVKLYSDEGFKEITELVLDVLVNMKSSKDLLDYSTRILAVDVDEFISVLELSLRDMLCCFEEREQLATQNQWTKKLKDAERFSRGAIIYALEKINEAQKRKKFNANPTMLIEWLLFQILEGKYKWQKL